MVDVLNGSCTGAIISVPWLIKGVKHTLELSNQEERDNFIKDRQQQVPLGHIFSTKDYL